MLSMYFRKCVQTCNVLGSGVILTLFSTFNSQPSNFKVCEIATRLLANFSYSSLDSSILSQKRIPSAHSVISVPEKKTLTPLHYLTLSFAIYKDYHHHYPKEVGIMLGIATPKECHTTTDDATNGLEPPSSINPMRLPLPQCLRLVNRYTDNVLIYK